MKLLRSASGKRRERAAKDVIHPAIRPRFFNGHDVVGFFDHANGLLAPRGPHTIQARIGIRNVVTGRTRADFLFRVANRIRERKRIFGRRSQQMKRQPLRGLLPNSGEMLQFINKSFDGSGKIRHAACVAQRRVLAQTA